VPQGFQWLEYFCPRPLASFFFRVPPVGIFEVIRLEDRLSRLIIAPMTVAFHPDFHWDHLIELETMVFTS
jgi:hypothetical protein